MSLSKLIDRWDGAGSKISAVRGKRVPEIGQSADINYCNECQDSGSAIGDQGDAGEPIEKNVRGAGQADGRKKEK